MKKEEKLEIIKQMADDYLAGKGTFTQLQKEYHVSSSYVKDYLREQGYIIKTGYKYQTVVGLKPAIEEYIANLNNKPSITKIAEKYGIMRKTLSDNLKELGYEIINYQNMVKFDNTIFDSIDTEEKAYWLGFIYADGYISSTEYAFEISLKSEDKEHLDKFNKFMKHNDPNHVKVGNVSCNEKICERCRWGVKDKHLWEILKSYGCIPNKSLVLKFPSLEIFRKKSLVKDFIRGYWDGDGTITFQDKEHQNIQLKVLGTEDFLTDIQDNLPLKYVYSLTNNSPNNTITKVLSINGKNAFKLAYYLYNNSNIYLKRKFDRYLYFCRVYKELYTKLQTENGEVCDDNPVLSSEIKESEPVQSVEIEPEKSE